VSRAGFTLGVATGWLIAPLFGMVSALRRARTFHPRGPIFHACISPHADAAPEMQSLAERLQGRALVRFSGALWKQAENIPDVLGCALRLRRDSSESAEAAGDDQDLLFATIRRPWTMPLSPFTTHVRDYLANDYYAVSPFDAGLGDRVYLKLHPERAARDALGTRAERLERMIERGEAVLRFDIGAGPFGPWRPLLVISLERRAEVDGEALRFSPFRAGRGVRPLGFVHALRIGAYGVSQRARPSSSSAISIAPGRLEPTAK
jgi:hypothetical protein